jgi:hypothetical protein
MKQRPWLLGALVLALVSLGLRAAAEPAAARAPQGAPGVELAQAISTVTGVAISPLLGVGAVGAYRYYQTPPERRAHLPWFARPHFWVPALLLVALVFAKDALGPAFPTALKKPFDALEVFENKVSALIAAGAFIPLILSVFPSALPPDSAGLGEAGLAVLDAAALGNALLVPFAVAAFAIVWLAAHAIHIFILISPFATVDAALKSLRLALLSTVTLSAFANPYVGALWSVILILLCSLVAGWSFRLMVFGAVFAWDLATFARRRFVPDGTVNPAFTARALGDVPVRTFGRVRRDPDGGLVLDYRPWLVLPRRRLILPAGAYAIGRGLLHAELLRVEGEGSIDLLDFPPRYRTHEDALRQACGLAEIRPVGWVAAWQWVKGLFVAGRPRARPNPGVPAGD